MDFVGADKSGANPLGQFVEHVGGDFKTEGDRAMWREMQSDMTPGMMPQEPMKPGEGTYYHDPRAGPFEMDPLHRALAESQRPPQLDGMLNDQFREFIHTTQTGTVSQTKPLPDMGLTPLEQEKVRNRSAILARHLNAEPGRQPFVDRQVNNLLHNLQMAPPPASQHEAMGQQGGAWANEFGADAAMEQAWRSAGPTHAQYEGAWQAAQMHQRQGPWAAEYANYGRDAHERGAQWANQFQNTRQMDSWSQEYIERGPQPMDAQAMEAARLQQLSKSLVDNVHDPKMQNSQLFKFLGQLGDGSMRVQGEELVPGVATATTTTATTVGAPDAAMMAQARHLEAAQRNEDMAAQYNEFQKDYQTAEPAVQPYEFTPGPNPYMNSANPYAEGMELLKNGNLTEAVLAFEAEVKLRPGNSDAWHMLGLSHAESDKDFFAIAALEQCLKLNPANSEALMALSVSYTNESNREKALSVLEKWIINNPKYRGLTFVAPAPQMRPPPAQYDGDEAEDYYAEYEKMWAQTTETHARVTSFFLQAANTSIDSLDADVQVGLGILYNLSQEFPRAAECFQAALRARPLDYLLWNKLGATLANDARSDEAVGAYFESLKINPCYVRAKVNLGISYSNMGKFDEAARHYLGALTLQAGARAPHLWHLLRLAFSMMNRRDLVELTQKANVDDFRREFDF